MHETPEGFLVCVGVPIARTGEMIYGEGETPLVTDDEGKVVVTRDEKDVFNPKTMASFEGKPITITHPTEFVNPENWKTLAKGIIKNVRRGEGDSKNDLIADLLITDSMAINLVKNGLREVSCGYEASYSQDEDGKGKQRNIIGNHLALVDEGRAGSSYAINDHKGKGVKKMKLKEAIKSIFAKAQDEAIKAADEMGEKKDDMKDAMKEDKFGNGLSESYDELLNLAKDLSSKIEKLSGAKDKDCEDEEKKDDSKKDDMKDADKDEEKKDESKDDKSSMEDRLKALEAAVKKLLEAKSGDEDKEEESKDDDGEEMEDDDMEENTMTGDEASRVEILAPGLRTTSKDFKVKALKAALETKDGKKVIDSLTNGKPTFDSAEKVDLLFIATSEALKHSRTAELSATKQNSSTNDSATVKGPMTAEEMNEINAKFYKRA